MNVFGTINTNYESYQRLVKFYHDTKDLSFERIDILMSGFFAANMCAAFGAILDKLIENINQIHFINIPSATETIMKKNGFLTYFGYQSLLDNHNTTIRYLKLKLTDGKYFNTYVIDELIGRAELPQMSMSVKESMAIAIYEIFVNAQIHSNSSYIYTCGQFYPREHKIEFTIVDTGIGFKRKINDRFGSNLSSTQAIQWATKDRNTTKEGVTGGIGLALLKEFIEKNKGLMQIVSDDGFYEYSYRGEQLRLFDGAFPGTIVNLQFRTDDNSSYILTNEIDSDNIF